MAVQRAGESGFTLIETLVSMVLFSVLAAISVSGFASWSHAQQEAGTQRELLSALRYAQERAVTEDTTYCVQFSTTSTWSVYRTPGIAAGTVSCSTATGAVLAQGPFQPQAPQTTLSGAVFAQRDSTNKSYALFYPSGSATPGSVLVSRSDSGKTYTVKVEGLTARVSVG